MFMYFLLPNWVPATWRSLAQTSISAEFPSGKAPTTRVADGSIPQFRRSITLSVRMRIQRLENILAYFRSEVEKCRGVEFGSYKCYTNVPGYNISCDKCLATEIRMLNDMEVKTVGCCCGHQKAQGYIQVVPECVEKMVTLGYQKLPEQENGNGKWCFAPKSVLLGRPSRMRTSS